MTHIRSLLKAATAFCNLQRVGILATHHPQGRDSLVEEDEVDWHEEDDPTAVEPNKKGQTPQSPTSVLELKVPMGTRWSNLCYMVERCTAVMVLWDPFNVGCSCLFDIALVYDWLYFAFQIVGIVVTCC